MAREASDLVLLDDAFPSIVAAIRQGRKIYDNIKKASIFIVAVHVPIAGLALLPLLDSAAPLILLPIHIVIIEMIIDPTCALVFEAEEADKDLMRRPARSPEQKLFSAREDRGDAVLSGRASVVRGFVVLWEDRVLRTLTIAYLIIAAIYLPTESIVLAAHFEALAEPASLGFVISMLAAGATIGAFGFGWLSARLSRPMILRVTLVGTAVSILPMALLPPVPWLASAGFFLGLFWGPLNPLVTTLIQQRVPADEQGRVISVQLSAFYAAPPLGMLLTGLAVERWGVADTYLALGVALAVTALAACLSKALRSDF